MKLNVAAAVPLAQLVEDSLALPPGEDLLLEGGVVGDGWERLERHAAILRAEYDCRPGAVLMRR